MPKTTALVDPEAMSRVEGATLIACERKIDQAMRAGGRIAGEALTDIRDKRLYRATHSSFEDYCRERWGFGRDAAERMIAVAAERALETKRAAQSAARARQNGSEPEISQREATRRQKVRKAGGDPGPVATPADKIVSAAKATGRSANQRRQDAVNSKADAQAQADARNAAPSVTELREQRRADKAEATERGPRQSVVWLIDQLHALDPDALGTVVTKAQMAVVESWVSKLTRAHVQATQKPKAASKPKATATACKHPPGRRIGDRCMVCNETV